LRLPCLTALLAGVVTVAGCTQSHPIEPGAARSSAAEAAATTSPVHSAPPEKAPRYAGSWSVPWKDAKPTLPGVSYQPLFLQQNQLPGNYSQGIITVSPDGRLLTSKGANGKGEQIKQDHLYWTGTGKHEAIPEPSVAGPPRQIVMARGDVNGEAWLETASTSLDYQDWHVFYHPRGGRSRLVADSARTLPGQTPPLPDGDNPMALTSRRIYWGATDVARNKKSVAAVILTAPRRRGAGRTRIVLRNAALPVAVGSRLIYLSQGRQPSPAGRSYTIKEMTRGKDKTLASGRAAVKGQVIEIAATKRYLAWVWGPVGSAGGTIYIEDRTTHVVGSIQLAHDDWATPITISGHYVAWGNGSSNGEGGEYVFDLRGHALWKLGSSPGYSEADIAGDTVVWATNKRGKITMHIARWLLP
jgi:hypothetical protein